MGNAPSDTTVENPMQATAAPASRREKTPEPTPSGCRGFRLKSNLRRERCPALPEADLRPPIPRRFPPVKQPAGYVINGTRQQSMEQDAAKDVDARHGRSSAWPRSSVRWVNGEFLTT
jgi:hypothetical protein